MWMSSPRASDATPHPQPCQKKHHFFSGLATNMLIGEYGSNFLKRTTWLQM